ncbi:MAG TPA: cytochrome c [Methylomirabilota bacterium]|nr:cytochrome c [Methylomirabilota bacterium]
MLASAGAASAEDGSIRAGRALLDENCSGCHAVGGSGDSPNTLAPPFRVVMRRYPAAALEESLAEGIVTGHRDMPEFELEPPAIADMVAYLDALAVVTREDPH